MMGMRPRSRVLWAVLAATALGWAGAARADLAASSPFLPPNSVAGAQAGGPAGPVELRGVMPTSAGIYYCIYDTARKSSAWVGVNEPGYDFLIKSADTGGDGVTLTFQGRTLHLVLRTAKIASAGPAGAQPVAGPAASGYSPPVVLNPSPADEQKRLDAVASEVRRRRLERERASQATQNGIPPAVPNR
jgi:hypothetical protein